MIPQRNMSNCNYWCIFLNSKYLHFDEKLKATVLHHFDFHHIHLTHQIVHFFSSVLAKATRPTLHQMVCGHILNYHWSSSSSSLSSSPTLLPSFAGESSSCHKQTNALLVVLEKQKLFISIDQRDQI